MRSAASASDAMEAFEELGQLVGGDTGAGVVDSELEVRAGVTQFYFDTTRESKLERVRDEIENDLLPHLSVDIGRLGQRRTIDVELQPCLLDRRAKDARKLRRESGKIDRFKRRPHAPGFDARKVEQRVDQLEQAQTVALDKID